MLKYCLVVLLICEFISSAFEHLWVTPEVSGRHKWLAVRLLVEVLTER